MKTNLGYIQLVECLNVVSKKYNGNICFDRLDQAGKWVIFTLRAKSGLPGSRNAASGRIMPKASWEVHGELFDEMRKIDPEVKIYSGGILQTEEWQDKKVWAGGEWVSMHEFTN